MEILRETTNWDFPNHTYLLNDAGKLVAFENDLGVTVLKSRIQFDKRYRTFEKVTHPALRKIGLAQKQVAEPVIGEVFKVKSDSGKTYDVVKSGGKYTCNCVGFSYRGKCKHSDQIRKQNEST